uniref:Ras-GEF domain-containing protein n=1 Tax=Strongyloides stercoralis TaxID=6248 RepID=A0A0K0EGP8_STRER
MVNDVNYLSYYAARQAAITLFISNVRWRKLSDVKRKLKDFLYKENKLPTLMISQIDFLNEQILREVQRWHEKHLKIFPENIKNNPSGTKRLFHPSEHLRLFYPRLVWKEKIIEIDDYKTAKEIVKKECQNWTLMEFQFAACYNMIDIIENERKYDKVRLRTLHQQLSDHPVYDFWIALLQDSNMWRIFFNREARLLRQKVSLLLQFAITNGFTEILRFIWPKISINHQEQIGFLCWKKVCFRAEHPHVVRFLCDKLCHINSVSLARLTWDCFYEKIYKATLDKDEQSLPDRAENYNKLLMLLQNWCPILRQAMLARENYRAITDMFRYRRQEELELFIEYLNRSQLTEAIKIVDKIYEKRRSTSNSNLREIVIRRQATV